MNTCGRQNSGKPIEKTINQVRQRRRMGREMRLTAKIGEYDMEQVFLDLGSDVNVLPKKTWELMGKPKLIWSPIQLRLANQQKIIPLGSMSRVPINLD